MSYQSPLAGLPGGGPAPRRDREPRRTGRAGTGLLRAAPDLSTMLMDVTMPETDGCSATAAIRGMTGLAGLPIITVIPPAMQGDRDESLAAGANGHITRPAIPENCSAARKRPLGVS